MSAIAIPKEITKGEELIVISRDIYEKLIRAFKRQSYTSSRSKLNVNLREALDDVKEGRVFGPFSTLSEGLKVLKRQAK